MTQFELFVTMVGVLLDQSAGKRVQHVYAQIYTLCLSMGYVKPEEHLLEQDLFVQTLKHMRITDAIEVQAALFHWNAVHGLIDEQALNNIQMELIEHPQFDPR